MKKIVITGGFGFIGSNLASKLALKNKVYIFDNFSDFTELPRLEYVKNINLRKNLLLKNCKVIKTDLLNKPEISAKILKIKPDIIVHLAALPIASIAMKNPKEGFESILETTFNILDSIKNLKKKPLFIYTSSSMVYGNFNKKSVNEKNNTNPIDIYGSFKLSGEIITKTYSKIHNFKYIIIRPSAVYGPMDNNERVIKILIKQAMKNKTLQVNNPKTTFLDFTYVDDLTDGFIKAINSKKYNEIFNLTCGNAKSLDYLLTILKSHFKNLKYKTINKKNFRPKRGTLRIDKAKNLLNYHPKFNLKSGINKYIEFLKKYG